MTKYAVASVGQHYILNGSLVPIPGTQNYVLINGTVIQLRLHEPYRDSQLNELLYVIIVIVFYATALMTLIITQIKRQRREGTEVDYYDEYLQRNSEVKRTCQAATNIVSKPPSNTQSQRVTAALASAAIAAASAGSIMGTQNDDPGSVALKERELETVIDVRGGTSIAGAGGSSSGGRFVESVGDKEKGIGVGSGSGAACSSLTPLLSNPSIAALSQSFGNTRLSFARELSPTRVLESIPDEGGEEQV